MELQNSSNELALPISYGEELTVEQKEEISGLKSTISIHDIGKVAAFGREEQATIKKLSDYLLGEVGAKEVTDANELLSKAIQRIKEYSESCTEKGFWAIFKNKESKLQKLQAKYASLQISVDSIVKELQKQDIALCQIVRDFEAVYNENYATYQYLTMVIFAGEEALNEEKKRVEEVRQRGKNSSDLMANQKIVDLEDDISKFERRLYDLKLSRTIAIQQAAQIRVIQKNANAISESIRATIFNAIPLWKSQMAIALGLEKVQANVESINSVNERLIDSLSGTSNLAKDAIQSRKEGVSELQENEAKLKQEIRELTTQ